MNLFFNKKLADEYSGLSQRIRVLSENWVDNQIFCPNCGNLDIDKYDNNKPAADFYCKECSEDYELKSKQNSVGIKILDGAHRTMLERLKSNHNPNFFLLNYNLPRLEVINFFVIPKHFLFQR